MKKKILIVDDDTDYIKAIRFILDEAGFECCEAHSAADGIDSVHGEKPDLIILDGMMEDISAGFRFTKELKEHGQKSEIPILMISSIQELTGLNFMDRAGSELLPVDAFLPKPVESDELLDKIGQLISYNRFQSTNP